MALDILQALALERARVRSYMLRAEQLLPDDTAYHQLTLDPGDGRARSVEAAADRARHRLGDHAIRPPILAPDPNVADNGG